MKPIFIYALIDPFTSHIRYIGKTDNLHKRYLSHINESKKKKTYKEKWIQSLLSKGKEPLIEIIDEVTEIDWEFWECHYISLYRSWGFKLTNNTLGGDSGPSLKGDKNPAKRLEVREKIKAAKKLYDNTKTGRYGQKATKETREKQSSQKSLFWLDAEKRKIACERMSASRKGKIPWNKGLKKIK